MKYKLFQNKVTQARSVLILATQELILEQADPVRYSDLRKKAIAAISRKQTADVIKSLGLKSVRGNLGGKYLE